MFALKILGLWACADVLLVWGFHTLVTHRGW